MRILWASTFPPRRCGIGDYTADLAAAFVKAGRVQLRVLTYPDGFEDSVTQEDGFQLSRKLGREPVAEHVASELEAFRPDLVHLQSSTFLHSPTVNRVVADACDVPLVTTVHDTPRSWRLFYTIPALRKVYARSARLIVHSTAVSRTLSRFHDVEGGKIVKIPHGVDIARYSPTAPGKEARTRYGLGAKRIVLFFGFLRPGKGLENLLEAWSLIQGQVPDAHLVVAGGTPSQAKRYHLSLRNEANYPTTLAELARSLGIESRVVFTGYVPEPFVPGLLSSADVLVLPYGAPFSQSGPLHKALASGKPLIASKVPGSADLLEDGKTALLTPAGDARSLADAIRLLLSNGRLAKRLAQGARSLAEENLDWSIIVRMTADLYEKTIARN